jgi:hypothetical protein
MMSGWTIFLANYPGNDDSRFLTTMMKIQSFENLALGWNYGEGGPIDPSVIRGAISILLKFSLTGLTDTDAFPGINGEVMVTAYERDHYLEAIVESNGSISVTYDVNDVEKFSKERMEPEEALTKLQDLAGQIWNTSDFYIRTISTLTLDKTGSRVWPSETLLAEVEHPLSNALASRQPMSGFATTYDTITPHGLQANHPFFGNLTKASSLQDIG